ncbi:hypothetical protein BGZ54_001195 [Gamsiella multidivaricata]|nr:hypothetical protein BGZ54_001195 [Gamsiella multidivaricata]
MAAWRKFIDSRQIPSNELIVVAGAFNVQRDSPEFNNSLVERLGVHPPDVYDGHASTWDPIENSIAHNSYPERKDGDYLDFVFVDKSHSSGMNTIVQTVLKVRSPNLVLGREVFDDFSDHFPVKVAIDLVLLDPLEPKKEAPESKEEVPPVVLQKPTP